MSNPTLWDFCVSIIGRADVEGSKGHRAPTLGRVCFNVETEQRLCTSTILRICTSTLKDKRVCKDTAYCYVNVEMTATTIPPSLRVHYTRFTDTCTYTSVASRDIKRRVVRRIYTHMYYIYIYVYIYIYT